MKKYPIDLKAVGSRLKAAREEIGMTMDQMREISGYSRSLISSAENGFKKPSVIYLFTLYERFNVNIHYLLNGEGSMFLESPPSKDRDGTEEAAGVPSPEFLQSDEKIRELLYLMEKIEMVRYAVLSNFIEYKNQNRRLIHELLEEALKNETENDNK